MFGLTKNSFFRGVAGRAEHMDMRILIVEDEAIIALYIGMTGVSSRPGPCFSAAVD
jgi:hypothetical protein